MRPLNAALATTLCLAPVLGQAETINVYGPGGPLPAMKEAAAAFGAAHPGTTVAVTAGPTPSWIDKAKKDADVIFSGSEVMMSDFITALGDKLDPASVRPLYLRAAAILVRSGNPTGITGIKDLFKPGHRILVVNGAGQQGLWEDVAGRTGDIGSVRAFRKNIVRYAPNSATARDAWTQDTTIDAWLIWTIWQVANPKLADQVAIEPEYRIYRDTSVALTRAGEVKTEAGEFARFLEGSDGQRIFAKWGWITPAKN